jgi:hypothetical protein
MFQFLREKKRSHGKRGKKKKNSTFHISTIKNTNLGVNTFFEEGI